MKTIITSLTLAAASFLFASCERNDSPAEDVAEEIGEAIEEIGDAVEEAVEESN